MQQAADEEKRAAKKAYMAEYRKQNPDRVKSWNENYRRNNPERFRQSQRDYKRRRYAEDPEYRLLCQLKSRLAKVVCRGYGVTKSVRMCGCSFRQLIQHLEAQFEDGMSWDRRSEWHIDHIFPLAAIDPSNEAHVAAVNNYRNLRPLWSMDNWKKNGAVTQEARESFGEIVNSILAEGANNAEEV
jgi:hypothetical protein